MVLMLQMKVPGMEIPEFLCTIFFKKLLFSSKRFQTCRNKIVSKGPSFCCFLRLLLKGNSKGFYVHPNILRLAGTMPFMKSLVPIAERSRLLDWTNRKRLVSEREISNTVVYKIQRYLSDQFLIKLAGKERILQKVSPNCISFQMHLQKRHLTPRSWLLSVFKIKYNRFKSL